MSAQSTRQLMDYVSSADRNGRREAAVTTLSVLTGRERDVALAVAQGKSNAEIADELEPGLATVKTQLTCRMTEARP